MQGMSLARGDAGVGLALVTRALRSLPTPVKWGGALWVVGLGLALFFSGFAASPEAEARRDAEQPTAAELLHLDNAMRREWNARHEYDESKGWFWSCPEPACPAARAEYEQASAALVEARAMVRDAQKRANSHVGMFSQHAVSEARALFWERAESGREFARRQSWFDLLFGMFFHGVARMNDEEGILGFAIRMLIRVMWNVVIAISGTFVSFAFSVRDVISMYSSSWADGLVFWLGAILAALAVSITACGVCCGCTGAIIVVPGIAMANRARNARLAGGAPGGGRYMEHGRFDD